jgi:hypothetical protein
MPRDPHQRRPTPEAPQRATRHSGYSLVEVVAAIALMGATLVPTVEFIRYGMERSLDDDRRQLLALYAVSQVEERLGVVAATWAEGTLSGDYASDGHPDIRFVTACSDEVASGGIVDTLMDIRSTVYYDANADDAWNAGEMRCTFRTKIGKFATYEALSL